ncbi:MAG: hypothetical protein ACU85V_12010 [Gammaproteobacteria bacterium]
MKYWIAALLVLPASALAAPCPDGEGPRAAVASYLRAMQEHRFADAYDFVTAAMTDGKPRADWAGLQRLFYQGGQVNIYGIDIRAPQAAAGDADCAGRALVPNVLKSRDKFNNQGTTEFEIYTTVRQGGTWRVEAQETLFDQPEVDRWFPGETLPEFRDQY